MKRILTVLLTLIFMAAVPFASYAMDGWQQEDNAWYYYRDDNKLTDEWINENGDTYYVGSDGKMYTGNQLIDGYLYYFRADGKLVLETEAVSNIWHDHKVLYSDGRGTLTDMTSFDALYGSSCAHWMDQTYGIYTSYKRTMQFYADLQSATLPSDQELLARDWGITNTEDGIATVNQLFNAAVGTDDKVLKAWNMSRAMMLCSSMREARWIEQLEYRDLQYSMAPTIQQSFSSWYDFFDNYMIAYRKWDKSVGAGSMLEREKAYEDIKKKIAVDEEEVWVPWDKELIKYW